MTRPLAECRTVVTGAGRGLGRAVAVAFAEAGASVWICARTGSELDATAAQIRAVGGSVESAQVDLGNAHACEAFVSRVQERSARVDVLVNNAAVLQLGPVAALPRSVWLETLAINLTAPFLVTQAFLPAMRRSGGSIINVSSRAGVIGFANEAAYCASKFGLEGFTRALALELQGEPVSVNTITPGLRIKPTSVTDLDVVRRSSSDRDEWEHPKQLTPAFVRLAQLRGEVSGLRFDALRLSRALEDEVGSTSRLKELAE